MSLIDKSKMELLEKEFKHDPDGLTLESFVWLLQNVCPFEESELLRVTSGLIKLFYDVDINGDGRLEWSEFNQYVMDEVMAQTAYEYVVDMSMGLFMAEKTTVGLQHPDAAKIKQVYSILDKNYVLLPPVQSINIRVANQCLKMASLPLQKAIISMESHAQELQILSENLDSMESIVPRKDAVFVSTKAIVIQDFAIDSIRSSVHVHNKSSFY